VLEPHRRCQLIWSYRCGLPDGWPADWLTWFLCDCTMSNCCVCALLRITFDVMRDWCMYRRLDCMTGSVTSVRVCVCAWQATVCDVWQCVTRDSVWRVSVCDEWQCVTRDSVCDECTCMYVTSACLWLVTVCDVWQCVTRDSVWRVSVCDEWQCVTSDQSMLSENVWWVSVVIDTLHV